MTSNLKALRLEPAGANTGEAKERTRTFARHRSGEERVHNSRRLAGAPQNDQEIVRPHAAASSSAPFKNKAYRTCLIGGTRTALDPVSGATWPPPASRQNCSANEARGHFRRAACRAGP